MVHPLCFVSFLCLGAKVVDRMVCMMRDSPIIWLRSSVRFEPAGCMVFKNPRSWDKSQFSQIGRS